MRKILLLLITISFIFIINKRSNTLVYVTREREEVQDNYIIDIKYPFFNEDDLDNLIDNYVFKAITSFKDDIKSADNYLYIDYDIINENNVMFDVYQEKDQVLVDSRVTLDIIKKDFIKDKVEEAVVKINNKKQDKVIAFTFDDGPSFNTKKVVDILDKYQVKATFFMLGSKIANHEEEVLYVYTKGMEIGNHTFSHKLLSRLTEEEIKGEITKTNKAIYNIIGTYPLYFRPSYGTVNNKIRNVSEMPLIIWSLDTLDWKYHNSTKIASKIMSRVKDGDIILMHDTYSSTVNALNKVIPMLINKGYRIVSVGELFKIKNKTPKLGFYYGNLN